MLREPLLQEAENARQRARRYWHVDGLTEMAFGAILLVLGAYFYAQATLPPETLLYQVLDVGFVLILIGSGLLAGRLVSAAKHRLTYPRTGYVAYPQPKGVQRGLGALLALSIGMLVAGLISAAPASLAWLPAISGLMLAAVLCFLGYRYSLARFFLIGLFSLAAGLVLALAGIGNLFGTAIFYFLAGLAALISGSLVLRAYLRSTSPGETQNG